MSWREGKPARLGVLGALFATLRQGRQRPVLGSRSFALEHFTILSC